MNCICCDSSGKVLMIMNDRRTENCSIHMAWSIL
jgi:hypothetical protein